MKNLILLGFAFIVSINLMAATPTYNLNAASMNIGKLKQASEGEVNSTFLIKRTAATPAEVKLAFGFNEYYSYCAEHDTQQVWVESSWNYVCHTHTNSSGDTVEYCTNDYTPGHYVTETVCVSYAYAAAPEVESLKLDFKKARKLTGSESETFIVELKQKSFTSEKFDIAIKPKSAKGGYEITRKKVLFWKTFGFKFKAI
jgi:hypothetical protein